MLISSHNSQDDILRKSRSIREGTASSIIGPIGANFDVPPIKAVYAPQRGGREEMMG